MYISCILSLHTRHLHCDTIMVDETSYLFRQMRVFYESKMTDRMSQEVDTQWDDDWEYYNEFSSQLSKESPHLIPFENTNGYVLTTTCPTTLRQEVSFKNIDFTKLTNTLEEYDGTSKHLIMHVSLWSLDTTSFGHSCLFVFCPKSHVQWFFEPSGITYTLAWRHLSSQPLVEGYTPCGITPCHAFQTHVEGIIGARQNTICGIICSLVNLQLALSYVEIEQVMNFWNLMVEVPLYWEQVKYCFGSFIAFYQTKFIGGYDGKLILT